MLRKKLIIAALVVVACIVGWYRVYPWGTWRFKTTITVQTPEGLKTGSAVQEIHAYSMFPFLGVDRDTYISLEKGEAVTVDLGRRGVLFVLMSKSIPLSVFPSDCVGISRCLIRYFNSLQEGTKVSVTPNFYPQMVHFKNLNDPHSVELLVTMNDCRGGKMVVFSWENRCIENNYFETAFGEGVSLSTFVIEKTEDNIEPKVLDYLSWLKNISGYLDGKRTGGGPALSNILDKGQFLK